MNKTFISIITIIIISCLGACNPLGTSSTVDSDFRGGAEEELVTLTPHHFSLSGHPTTALSGATNSITVVVQDINNRTITNYTGTIHFTSSDGAASLPVNYTFLASDQGVKSFSGITFSTTGTHSITATDTITNTLTGSQSGIVISAGGINSLIFSTQPATTGDVDSILTTQPVVTGLDANSNVVADSVSTVTLTAHSDATCSSADVSGGLVATTNPVTMVNGVATFAGVHIRKTNVVRIKATAGGISVCSNAIALSAGALSLTTSNLEVVPVSVAADNSSTATFTVNILDQYENGISGQSVTLVSSRGATDTITTSPATTNASGAATFTVKSSTVGNPTLTATMGAFSKTRKLYFLSQTPLVDYQAIYAKEGSSVGDSTVTQWWNDLYLSANTNNMELFNFPDPNTLWAGNGGVAVGTDPYRLTFSSASSRYMEGTTVLNAGSDLFFETWVRPSSSSTTGSVILSNADAANKGFMIQQSKTEAGKVEVKLGAGNTYADEVLSDNPIAYWRLGDVSGNTALNIGSCGGTPSNCNGTYTSPTLNVTHEGADNWNDSDKAITKTVSTYVTVTNNASLEPTEISFEAWVKGTAPGTFRYIVDKVHATAGASYALYTGGGGGLCFFVRLGPPTNALVFSPIAAPAAIWDGNWHHVVGTYDSVKVRLYIDGVEQGAGTATSGSIEYTADNLILGHTTAGFNFPGSVDEIALYGSALSLARIQAHYNARSRPICRSVSTLTNSAWSHLAGSYNSINGNFKLYFNGTQECGLTVANPAALYSGSVSPLAAGAHVDSLGAPTAGTYWSGDFAEIRGSNTVPSANSNLIDHYNSSKGNYPSFAPSDVAGLALWLDANDSSTLFQSNDCTTTAVAAANDPVGCWKDKSGNGRNVTQAIAGNKAIYRTNQLNTLPSLEFVTASVTNLKAATGVYDPTKTVSIFAVTKNSSVMNGAIVSTMTATTGLLFRYRDLTGTQLLIGCTNAAVAANYPNGTIGAASGSYHLLTFKHFGTSASAGIGEIGMNGNLLATSPSYLGTANAGVLTVGALPNSVVPLNGFIAEILIYQPAVSLVEQKRIEAYLNAKYKIY